MASDYYKYWTPEDLETLKRLYGTMPKRELASLLGKKVQALYYMAYKLKITTPKNTVRKHCIDCGVELSRAAIYTSNRTHPTVRCRKCADINHSSERHHNWKGGVAQLRSLVHIMLKPVWINPIMKRDGYMCQLCKQHGGDMHVHHLIPYRIIRDMVIKNNPEISLDSFEGKKEIAAKIAAVHELNFGVTLCVSCHKKIHCETRGELLENPTAERRDNQQPSRLNVIDFVSRKVQRLTGEDTQTNKPDTSAPLIYKDDDDIVCSYR